MQGWSIKHAKLLWESDVLRTEKYVKGVISVVEKAAADGNNHVGKGSDVSFLSFVPKKDESRSITSVNDNEISCGFVLIGTFSGRLWALQVFYSLNI